MGFSIRNSRLASVGLASVIAVGVIGVGSVALADEPDGGGQSTAALREGKHRPVLGSLKALLKDTGVTREEVKEGAAAGLTLGQIIDQYGDISAEQAKANALAALSDKLDEAVETGRITQERADEIEGKAPALLDRLLNAVPGEHKGEKPHARIHAIGKHALETVAEVLGTDVESLKEELRSGKTVAEIAGPQTQAVIDALVADANEAIDRAVAEGKLPADKAETAKERAEQAITKFVNEGRPNKPGAR